MPIRPGCVVESNGGECLRHCLLELSDGLYQDQTLNEELTSFRGKSRTGFRNA